MRYAELLSVFLVEALTNVPGAGYARVWSTRASLRVGNAEMSLDLQHWVNDAAMAVFPGGGPWSARPRCGFARPSPPTTKPA